VPTLRDIRRRIVSVQSTQQVTRTMKMVAQARLRRLQSAMLAFRRYAHHLRGLLGEFLTQAVGDEHPLLEPREGDRALLVVMVGDRGLCGPFNGTMLRHAEAFLADPKNADTRLVVVGRKGVRYFARRGVEILEGFEDLYSTPTFNNAADIVARFEAPFVEGSADRVHLLYSRFGSAMRQEPVVEPLLPFSPEVLRAAIREGAAPAAAPDGAPPDHEPSFGAMCQVLLRRALGVIVYHALLETACSIFSARMVAMDQATDNAGEMIEQLTLLYHRTRQTNITKELMDIIGGITGGS